MKTGKSILLLIVCTCLALGLIVFCCGDASNASGEDSGLSTAPSADYSDGLQGTVKPAYSYAAAVGQLQAAQDLAYSYSFQQSRQLGGETYSESRVGTAMYTNRGTDSVEALVSEDVSHNSYSAHFTESYLDGRAYAQVRGTSFASDVSAEDFQARQIPAVLMDESLYDQVETDEDRLQYTFSEPTALESWVDPTGQAELIRAGGTVSLSAKGQIKTAEYYAEYRLGTVCYTLQVSMTVTAMPEEGMAQPEYPQDCAVIDDLEILRYMFRTVGGVYSTNSASAEYVETLYFGYLQASLTNADALYFHRDGENLVAKLQYQRNGITATGSNISSSQTNLFRDGKYSVSINGDAPYDDNTYTADMILTLCTNSMLNPMMVYEHIAAAQISDSGDFYVISFEGNDSFIQYFSGNIYALMGYSTSLDISADSCATGAAGGYLVINKYTLLPTAMGLSLERTHVFSNVSYPMNYHLDQSLTLSCPNAYESITGEPAAQAEGETVTPLFYQVTGSDGQKMWLLGTMDVGDERAACLPAVITDALVASQALAVEYDGEAFAAAVATDANLQSQLGAAYYYQGSTTAEHLSGELYAQLYPAMLATGLYNAGSSYLKPIIWQSQIENLYLTQQYGLNSQFSGSRCLLQLAEAEALPVYEMSSGLALLQTLTGLSEDVQSLLLQRLLDQGMLGYYTQLQQEYELWCRGDEAGLLQLTQAATEGMSDKQLALYEAYYSAVIADRTRIMCNAAVRYLESGETVFCAVHVTNLLGEKGMIEALRAAGYTVEAVTYE